MPATNPPAACRPCLVLALADAASAAETGRRFRRSGWDVYPTPAGPDARRLCRLLEADLVVLDADLGGESGFLTCAKLTRERPACRVVLVSDDVGARASGLAHFVGAAALVRPQDCLPSLAPATGLPTLPLAG
jgi:DNA-binding response OmpR family regulator